MSNPIAGDLEGDLTGGSAALSSMERSAVEGLTRTGSARTRLTMMGLLELMALNSKFVEVGMIHNDWEMVGSWDLGCDGGDGIFTL